MIWPHEYKMPIPDHLPTPDLTRGKTNPAIMAPITLPRPFQVNTAETSDFLSFQNSSHKTRLTYLPMSSYYNYTLITEVHLMS